MATTMPWGERVPDSRDPGFHLDIAAAMRASTDRWVAESLGGAGRPTIVCLCGSTRFYDEFMQANYELTMAGCIVLSVGFFWNNPQAHGEGVGLPDDPVTQAAVKEALDELHLRKIDLADMVVVINKGGYVGESTTREIRYAREHGKRVVKMFGEDPAAIEARGAELVRQYHPTLADQEGI